MVIKIMEATGFVVLSFNMTAVGDAGGGGPSGGLVTVFDGLLLWVVVPPAHDVVWSLSPSLRWRKHAST